MYKPKYLYTMKNRNNLISYICFNLFNKKKYNFKSLSKVNTQVERIKYNFQSLKLNKIKKYNLITLSNKMLLFFKQVFFGSLKKILVTESDKKKKFLSSLRAYVTNK